MKFEKPKKGVKNCADSIPGREVENRSTGKRTNRQKKKVVIFILKFFTSIIERH
jgi:hypothetical protein